jgi:hypothetical protein
MWASYTVMGCTLNNDDEMVLWLHYTTFLILEGLLGMLSIVLRVVWASWFSGAAKCHVYNSIVFTYL